MAYKAKAYTLREESTESGTRYFISFKDGQGKSPRVGSVGTVLLWSFGRWNAGTGIFSNGTSGTGSLTEVWDETLYRRALRAA